MKFRNSRSAPLLQPFHFKKDSKVQEQFAFDCDINNIVAGMTAPLPIRQPVSDEVLRFSPDMYEKALYTKALAENAFNELPSKVRTFFDNNPKKMLEFVSDPSNKAKCVELGLMNYDYEKNLINNINYNLEKMSVKNVDEKPSQSVTLKESQGG